MASALIITIDMQAINQGNRGKQRGKERGVVFKEGKVLLELYCPTRLDKACLRFTTLAMS